MTAALQVSDLHKSFGSTPIIRGVNLDIRSGERHAIIGPNGAGKSTLFHLISGRYEPTAGRVSLHGQDITGLPPYQINRMGLARSFQVTNLFHRMTAFENVRCGLLWAMGYRYSFWHLVGGLSELNERADHLLERIHLAEKRNVPVGLLTYADQRALEIGLTIAGGAETVLLDEPTAGMSRSETEYAVELIKEISEDKTLVIVEHDMSVVFNLAHRVSVLVYGQIIATDEPAAIKSNRDVQEAYLGTEAH